MERLGREVEEGMTDCRCPLCDDDFYEDDEDPTELLEEFEQGEKGTTVESGPINLTLLPPKEE